MSRGLPSRRTGRLVLLLLVSVTAAAMVAGCGGDKDEESAEQSGADRMVPGGTADSTVVDRESAPLEESSYQAGTLASDEGVTGSVDETTPDTTRPEAELKAAPAPSTAAPVTTSSRPAVSASGSGGDEVYSLQLGSFTNQANARQQADRITALGYAPVIEETVLAGQKYHRVMLRNIGDMAEASRLGEHIHSELDIAYLVRRAK